MLCFPPHHSAPWTHPEASSKAWDWKIKISPCFCNSVCMFIWLAFKSRELPPAAFSPQTTSSSANHHLRSTTPFSSNLLSSWLKSITSLEARAPVNPVGVQSRQCANPPPTHRGRSLGWRGSRSGGWGRRESRGSWSTGEPGWTVSAPSGLLGCW